VKLVIWDFDGTLADTRPIIEAGMDHAIGRLGLDPAVREEWLKYVGLPVEEGIRRTFGPLGLTVEEVLPVYRTFKHAEHEHLITGFDGITELLAELHGRGVLQAIASSKRGEPLRRQVAALEWSAFFHPIITPDDVAHAKPDPESIVKILGILDIPAGDAVMVGDTPFDLEMAQRAGVRGVAVGHGFYGERDLAAYDPMGYAPDTGALRDILLAWSAR
jgi:HAD superfamily hydrolase (TIGR01549 family)